MNRSHNVFGLEHRRRWEWMVRSKWSDDITFTLIFISQQSYGLFWKSVTNYLFCHFAKRPFYPAAEDRQEQHLGGKQPWSTLSNTSLYVKHSQWALRSTTEWCQDITSWSHMDANMTAALMDPCKRKWWISLQGCISCQTTKSLHPILHLPGMLICGMYICSLSCCRTKCFTQ